jgi:predicted aconitase with swiveling domain
VNRTVIGRPVIAGSAEGIALVSAEPLSFWGGYDPTTGEIIDRRHDRSGAVARGRVLVFPRGRGSSTSSAILLESLRNGTAPAAVINLATDPILALGAIVAHEFYRISMPIVVLSEEDFFTIRDGDHLTIDGDGVVSIERPTPR